MKKTVIAIVGPTAVGKTELSIELAKEINGEIINGDSVQVYRGMNIGSAKILPEEMQGIPHHLLDIKDPDEEYTVADFKLQVQKLVEEISEKGRIPIIVGGSGLYIQSALYDYNFPDIKKDEEITKQLEEELEELGLEKIYERLQLIDPEQAAKIHPNNYRRVIRAIEIYQSTGKTKTDWEKEQQIDSPYNVIFIGLTMEREELYKRINKRVDLMLHQGLIDEVKSLCNKGYKHTQAMRAIGYKEIIPYLEGKVELEDAVELLKRNSRRFAKRQFTWFRNRLEIDWYSVTPASKNKKFTMIIQKIAGILKMK
ncbi:tRNA (adenosine(37)-N6)-dimethylallyltransferase MiaA [Oceanobacillus sp. CAU 1775]